MPAPAGVATAFAAPIGGLLFTIEEGASFYSTSIFWRSFLSTCIGVLTLHFLVSCAVRKHMPYQDMGDNSPDQTVIMTVSITNHILCLSVARM